MSASKARPTTHTTAADAPCSILPTMRPPIELPKFSRMVAPKRTSKPRRSGVRRDEPRSASHPQMGENARSAAPYTATSTETQYWTWASSTWLSEPIAKGMTGTMTPYRNMSFFCQLQAIAILGMTTYSKNSQVNSPDDECIRASDLEHERRLGYMIRQ